MRNLIFLFAISSLFLNCNSPKNNDVTTPNKLDIDSSKVSLVASITGQQLTGITVSDGRIFVNFPRWRENVKYSVTEIKENDNFIPYPNEKWNSWEIGKEVNDSIFVAVQSVVASNNKLYVVDTRKHTSFEGVFEQPIIFVFDLKSNELDRIYKLTQGSFHKDSYINDIRIDKNSNYAFMTDSDHPGLVVLNLETGISKRVLDNHKSTTAEVDSLTFNGDKQFRKVHSDGIAIDTKNGILYFHALSGYNLYKIPTDILIHGDEKEIQNAVELVGKTAAPDGMVYDQSKYLYYADLENDAIMRHNLIENKIDTLINDSKIVSWADTFSLDHNFLYYTNAHIHEIPRGGDVKNKTFTVYKIAL